jgi:hypothetical protein
MSEPTKQQIDQAERLQKAGLCIHAGNKIWKNGTVLFIFHRTDEALINLRAAGEDPIGPVPTFEEVWVELVKSMFYSQDIFQAINMQMQKMGSVNQPTTAAIEALLLLTEGE